MQRRTASHCGFRQMGPRKRDVTSAPQIFPLLTQSPSGLECVRCVETKAEWDAAVDCLAVSISPYWALKRTIFAPGPFELRLVAINDVNAYVYLMFGNASRAGCGGGLPRIECFAEWDLDSASS